MKKKILTLILLSCAFAALVVIRTSSKVQESIQYPTQDRLQWYAKKTKQEGKNRVSVPGPIIDYAGVDMDFDEAIRDYSGIVGEPVASKSYIVNSEDVITWYKFRILETLSYKKYVYCHTCADIPDVPGEMSPVSPNEFLLTISGGTVIVDGVEVTMENYSIPAFESGKKYLFFVSLTPSRVAVLGAGPSGIFRVNEDDTLEPVRTTNAPLNAQIRKRFNLNLSKLKSHVKN